MSDHTIFRRLLGAKRSGMVLLAFSIGSWVLFYSLPCMLISSPPLPFHFPFLLSMLLILLLLTNLFVETLLQIKFLFNVHDDDDVFEVKKSIMEVKNGKISSTLFTLCS